jgi:GTP-binding protein
LYTKHPIQNAGGQLSLFPHVKFMLSVAAAAQFPPDQGLDVAIAGRSNAGKSSAINAILARHGLARTSKTPGRTQLLNYFELLPNRRLVDLPGYGHASVPGAVRSKWGPLIEGLSRRECFGALLLIVDSRRGLQEKDFELLEWAGLPADSMHVLLSKSDQLSRSAGHDVLRASQAQLEGIASVQLFSALRGVGLEDARTVLKHWCTEKIKGPGG